MGINNLTPALVHEYVEKELALRCRSYHREDVRFILRSGAVIGSRIDLFEDLPRGMDHAENLITDFEQKGVSFPSGLVIAARKLSGGQGRFGRYWHAPEGGVWLTLVLVNTLLSESARILPLAVGVASCETVRQYIPDAKIKWVNDIHVNKSKVAGILTKTMTGPKHREEYILTGIGVNVNNDEFPADLVGVAQSIRNIYGKDVDPGHFAAQLLAKLVWNIGLLYFYEQKSLLGADFDPGPAGHPLISAWRALSDTIGRRVFFGHNVQENPQYEATVKTIQADGALVLELAGNGGEIIENSGELIYLD